MRCNTLTPGLVMRETRKKQNDNALEVALSLRLGRPADMAGAVAFLFADDAEWIDGQA
nr:hypothetical protein [Streptomyces sp. NBRC 110468]